MTENSPPVQPSRRPTALPPQPQNIPDCLKTLPRWVCWQYRLQKARQGRQERWAKVPLNPRTGRAANVEVSDTWGTFTEALALVKEKALDGLGFVLGVGLVDGNPHRVTVIDLDHCRDPQTCVVKQEAMFHVQALHSYTEISPSGEGLHVFCLADLGPGRNKRGNVEIYHQGRYIAMTGHRLEGTPAEIEQRHGEASTLRREWIGSNPPKPAIAGLGGEPREALSCNCIETLKAMKDWTNWPHIAELLGRVRDGTRDESAADMSLCRILAFACYSNAEQMEAIWRTGQCWGIHSDRPDYVKRTIAQAIAYQGGVHRGRGKRFPQSPAKVGDSLGVPPYSPSPPPESSTQVGGSGEPLREEVSATPPHDGELTQGPTSSSNGVPRAPTPPPPVSYPSPASTRPNAPPPPLGGVLLSTLREGETEWFWEPWFARGMLNLLIGRPNTGKSSLLAWLMTRAQRTILLPGYEEDVRRLMMPRFRVHGVDPARVRVLNDQHYNPIAQEDVLVRQIREFGADLFIVETIDSYLPGDASENISQDVRPYLESWGRIFERTGTCGIGTRHPGKDPTNLLPGSRSWGDVPRIITVLEKDEGPPLKRFLRSHKCGVAPDPTPLSFELVREGKAPPVFTPGQAADRAAMELARDVPDLMDRLVIDQAKEVLMRFLGDGKKESQAVFRHAETERLNEKAMRRAAKLLGVKIDREGQGINHKSFWSLP